MALKVLCLLKNTFPTDAKVALDASGGVSDAGVKCIINPYDEIAIEQGCQYRDTGAAESLAVVCVGGEECMESVRRALAMGADSAILVDPKGVDKAAVDESVVAQALVAVIRKGSYDLLLCGKTSVDSNAAEVPARVAEALGIPYVSAVSAITLGDGQVVAEREADGQVEKVQASLPALLGADKNLNKPRYPSLPNIMKAKKKPVEALPLASLVPDAKPTRRTLKISLPPTKGPAKMIAGNGAAQSKELVRLLRDEAKVL